MLSRLSRISRQIHQLQPLHLTFLFTQTQVGRMAAIPRIGTQRKVHTAGCIIIGDEILSGKVGCSIYIYEPTMNTGLIYSYLSLCYRLLIRIRPT